MASEQILNCPSQVNIKQCPALGAAIILPMSMFLNGYWQGYTSPVLKEFQQLGYLDPTTIPIFSGCSFIGGVLGIVFVGLFGNFLGRRFASLILLVIGTVGWMMLVVGVYAVQLILGIMAGAMCGSGMSLIAVIYISELAHKSRKKTFSRFIMCYLRLGILGAYLLGIVLSFRWLAIVPMCIIVFLAAYIYTLPESPVWLTLKGKTEYAKRVYTQLHGPSFDSSFEVKQLERQLKQKDRSKLTMRVRMKDFFTVQVLKPILLIVLIHLIKEASGHESMVAYASIILSLSEKVDPKLVELFPATFLFLGSLGSLLTVRIKRKLHLSISMLLMALSLLSLTVYFALTSTVFNCSQSDISTVSMYGVYCDYLVIWPAVSVAVYLFNFSFGWAMIVWMLYGEIFQPDSKELSAALATIFNNLSKAVIVFTFPFLSSFVGMALPFALYFSVASVGFALVFCNILVIQD